MWMLLFCVFVAGVVDAIAGGGGLITLPAYYAFGVPPHMALGTNKFASTMGTLTASARFVRYRQIRWRVALWASGAALLGSPVGAKLAMAVEEKYLKYLLLGVVPLLAVLLFTKKDLGAPDEEPLPRWKEALAAAATGLVIGVYDGFFGPGTGTFLTLVFMSLLRLDVVKACGTTKIVNLSSNVAALITYALGSKVLWNLALPCAAVSILGNWVGSGLALKNGLRIVRPVMLIAMALLLCKVAADMI